MPEQRLALAVAVSVAVHAALLYLSIPPAVDQPWRAGGEAMVARLVEAQPEVAPARAPLPKKIARATQLPEASTPGEYRYLLAEAAVRHNAYPPEALVNGWEGEVVVRVVVAASGAISEVSVARSSGHAPLDEQALDMFRRAAREVPVPRALRGREFGVELSTTYRSG